MNKFKHIVEVETSSGKFIEVTLMGEWQNNGIGAYEFWGQKCFDKGENYPEIQDFTFKQNDLSPDEIDEIKLKCQQNLETWAKLIEPPEVDCREEE